MTDKERLIELLDGYYSEEAGNVVCYFTEKECEELADYLFENGVIVPPCKFRDKIYEIVFQDNAPHNIVEHIVVGLHYTKENRYGKLRDNQYLVTVSQFCNKAHHININKLGKTVFLTREEAERALKDGEQQWID